MMTKTLWNYYKRARTGKPEYWAEFCRENMMTGYVISNREQNGVSLQKVDTNNSRKEEPGCELP